MVAEAADGVPLALGFQRVEGTQVYNSLAVLDGTGRIATVYDKHHLVPFGEYLPLGDLAARFGLTGFATRDGNGFSAGPGPRLLDLSPLGRALPLICYEAIFPPGHPRRARTPRLAPSGHQRRLVRPHRRAPAASRAGAGPRSGTRAATGPGRQYRHFGRDRRERPGYRRDSPGRGRLSGCAASAGGSAHALRENRRRTGPVRRIVSPCHGRRPALPKNPLTGAPGGRNRSAAPSQRLPGVTA